MAPPREKLLLGTSLKMYFDLPSTLRYLDAVASLAPTTSHANLDFFIIPDFVSLHPAHEKLQHATPSGSIWLGAQDCHDEDAGAFTGEVSPRTLRQAGVRLVEIGHAERRRLFGETDAHVARKAAAVVRNDMIPLVCIGEKNRSEAVAQGVSLAVEECRPQVAAALSMVPDDAEVIFAYEPVWAIGAAQPAEAAHVVGVANGLREMVSGRAGRTRILYGGSAGPGTWATVRDGVDGLFLGRFAHDVKNLEQVVKEMRGDD